MMTMIAKESQSMMEPVQPKEGETLPNEDPENQAVGSTSNLALNDSEGATVVATHDIRETKSLYESLEAASTTSSMTAPAMTESV